MPSTAEAGMTMMMTTMTPDQPQRHSYALWWWLVAIVILILCFLGGYAYYRLRAPKGPANDARFEQAREFQQQALAIQRSGTGIPSYDDAANLLKKAIAVNDSPALEGYLKVNLALLMHLSGEGAESGGEQMVEGGLPPDAVEMLKEAALDQQYAPGARALAFNTIAETFINHYSSSTLATSQEKVFSGPVFGDLLQNGNVQLGLAGIYDLSASYYSTGTSTRFSNGAYDLYSNIISSYRAANIYLEQALTDPSLSASDRAALYTKAKERLAAGDAFTARFSADITHVSAQKRQANMDGEYRNLGDGQRLRAAAYGKIYLLDAKPTSAEADQVNAAFKAALDTLGKSDTYMVRKIQMYTRLDYATWLAAAHGTNMSSDIAAVLAPMYADHDANSVVRERLKDEAGLAPNVPFEGIGMILIAQASEPFKAFAEQNQWTAAQLAAKQAPFHTISFQ